MPERQPHRLLEAIEHDRRAHMRHALVRQEHLVEDPRERLEIRNRQLDEVIRLAGQRIGFLHFLEAFDQLHEALGVVGRVCRQRHLHEHDHVEPERLRRQRGVIAADDAGVLQRLPAPRALRRRQAHTLGEIVVGQPAIVLQCAEQVDIEIIHARFPLILAVERIYIACIWEATWILHANCKLDAAKLLKSATLCEDRLWVRSPTTHRPPRSVPTIPPAPTGSSSWSSAIPTRRSSTRCSRAWAMSRSPGTRRATSRSIARATSTTSSTGRPVRMRRASSPSTAPAPRRCRGGSSMQHMPCAARSRSAPPNTRAPTRPWTCRP